MTREWRAWIPISYAFRVAAALAHSWPEFCDYQRHRHAEGGLPPGDLDDALSALQPEVGALRPADIYKYYDEDGWSGIQVEARLLCRLDVSLHFCRC